MSIDMKGIFSNLPESILVGIFRGLPDETLAGIVRAMSDEDLANFISHVQSGEEPVSNGVSRKVAVVRRPVATTAKTSNGKKEPRARASSEKTDDRAKKVLASVKSGHASVGTISESLGLDKPAVARTLKALMTEGEVFCVGERRFARYGVTKEAAKKAHEHDRYGK